jgi:hypothetical protein
MPLSEQRSERKERRSERKVSIVRLSEYALLVVIAIGFLVLHILTGATFWPASKDPAAITEPAKALSGD